MDNEEKKIKELRKEAEKENETVDIFSVEEVIVEEMAIDGICGVY